LDNFFDYILTVIALIFVIEGLLYAIFPDAMRRVLAMALTIPSPSLRRFGILMVICGFGMVMLIQALGL